MHSFYRIIPVFIIVLCALSCTDLDYTPYDSHYIGDYTLSLHIDKKPLYAFVPYSFYYSCGDDRFSTISAHTIPSGNIDTSFFILKLQKDSAGIYFTHAFSGSLCLTGIRPNEITDTFSLPVSILNPFTILQKNIFEDVDLTVISSGCPAIEYVKRIIWFINSLPADTLSADIPFKISPVSKKTVIVSAQLDDWLGNTMPVHPCTLNINNPKPQIRASIINSSRIFTNDTIRVSTTVFSQLNDTGIIRIIGNNDTTSIPVILSGNDSLKITTSAGIATREGTFVLNITYTGKKGISISHSPLYLTVLPSFFKQTISTVQINPDHIYNNEPVNITVFTTPSPAGEKYQTFYWDTTGDTIWDIITKTPSLSLTFTTDTVHLAVRCSDSTGFLSDIFHTVLPVDSGIPVIDEIRIPQVQQYANKSFDIEIKAHDNSGGVIDSYKTIIVTADADTFIRISKNNIQSISLDTFFCGNNSITALVKDLSGHWSKPFKYPATLEISPGFPEIKTLSITDTAWYLKPLRLRIDAIDYNGTIKSVIIDWNDSHSDTIKSKETLIAIDKYHIYDSNPEKTGRNIRVSVTDNDNNTTIGTVTLQLHSGIPSIAVSSSPFTCVSNDTTYIQNTTFENRFDFYQVISLHYTSSDSNGLPLYYYCDIDSPYGYSFNDAEGFTIRSDSMQFTSKFSFFTNSIFSTDSPAVKAVLFCIDNDGLAGTDTFYIRTYTLPAVTIIKPVEGSLINRSNLSVTWTGGVDQFLLLDTKFKLTIKSNYPSQTDSYSTMSQHTGYLKDIVTSISPYEFTFKEDSSFIISAPSGTSIFYQLEIFDRLGQITTASVSTTTE